MVVVVGGFTWHSSLVQSLTAARMALSGFGGSGFNRGRSPVDCRYLRFLGGSVFGGCYSYGIEGLILVIAAPHQMC